MLSWDLQRQHTMRAAQGHSPKMGHLQTVTSASVLDTHHLSLCCLAHQHGWQWSGGLRIGPATHCQANGGSLKLTKRLFLWFWTSSKHSILRSHCSLLLALWPILRATPIIMLSACAVLMLGWCKLGGTQAWISLEFQVPWPLYSYHWVNMALFVKHPSKIWDLPLSYMRHRLNCAAPLQSSVKWIRWNFGNFWDKIHSIYLCDVCCLLLPHTAPQ